MEKLLRSIQSSTLTSYPITDGFYQLLSEHLGLSEDRILLTPGSDAAIKALYHAYVSPGDTVVILDPSYAMYAIYGRMFQANVRAIPFDERLHLDTERLLAAMGENTRLVMLANPNQPTATLLDDEVLDAVIRRAHEVDALVAVDEAYFPFSGTTVLPRAIEFPNLVVTRTFSKAAGLAALRIGYAVGHPDVIGNLFKVRSVHDINSIALLAASLLVSHPEIMADYAGQVSQGAEVLTRMANDLGLRALPTHTNFMQIQVGQRCDPSRLVSKLEEKGFLVRSHTGVPCLEGCIRVTLGPPNLMVSFARALQDALAEITGPGAT
jgi:histidinol-phosphate aminotransferase